MTTRREQVIAQIETALAAISTANGYTADFSVQRRQQRGQTVKDPVLVIVPAGEAKTPEGNRFYQCSLTVLVIVQFVHEAVDPDHLETTDEIINRMVGDVERALMADSQLGGLADTFFLEAVDEFQEEEGQAFVGAVVRTRVDYFHRFADPRLGR